MQHQGAQLYLGPFPSPPRAGPRQAQSWAFHSFREGRAKRGGRKGPLRTLKTLIRCHAGVCLHMQIACLPHLVYFKMTKRLDAVWVVD